MTPSLLRTAALGAVCAALTVGCASDRHRHEDGRNAAVGAVGGAVIGAATGGNALTGAVVGAVAGALIGRLMVDGREREVYSDGRGGRYWVDEDGRHRPMR
ncbi:YMGG-like glycine zipper-containing protein [Roseateles amylovorans]|jgi:Glycine zipper|uniref:Glycine zipper domain-containing protein n=1 Tax=Roseateles amylovorans TaxID=2978473 RepID=A0ABY6B362_9BURK|nr:YMGG-like glycine zipper-containing protein [Roseateles amylovorans]UXH79664.1 glycine zipper domain-containing protein [Roseateles amylovorans]